MPRTPILLAVCLIALSGADPVTAQRPDLAPYIESEDQAASLEDGEMLEFDGVSFPAVFGEQPLEDGDSSLLMFLVDAPADTVWSVLSDFDDHPEFMPHMSSVETRPDSGERSVVCYTYEILWIESTNCFSVRADREAGLLVGELDPDASDDRLEGVQYFWHLRRWSDEQILLAYYQDLAYSGFVAAVGHKAFVGTRGTADAVRQELRRRAGGGS